MPSESPVLHRLDPDAGLVETFRWSAEDGFFLLEEHLTRLTNSARILGFPVDPQSLRDDLAVLDAKWREEGSRLLRVRLLLSRGSTMSVETAPLTLPNPDTIWRVVVAPTRFRSDDPALRHKTSDRDRYERPLAEATRELGADEVIFLNERDEVCEGARSTLFLAREGLLWTPRLSAGLLPGTLRAALLTEGRAVEATIRPGDLAGDAVWFMGNAVRGLVRARLIER